jgi:soluble P-type ATPase
MTYVHVSIEQLSSLPISAHVGRNSIPNQPFFQDVLSKVRSLKREEFIKICLGDEITQVLSLRNAHMATAVALRRHLRHTDIVVKQRRERGEQIIVLLHGKPNGAH